MTSWSKSSGSSTEWNSAAPRDDLCIGKPIGLLLALTYATGLLTNTSYTKVSGVSTAWAK